MVFPLLSSLSSSSSGGEGPCAQSITNSSSCIDRPSLLHDFPSVTFTLVLCFDYFSHKNHPITQTLHRKWDATSKTFFSLEENKVMRESLDICQVHSSIFSVTFGPLRSLFPLPRGECHMCLYNSPPPGITHQPGFLLCLGQTGYYHVLRKV